ncbi:hypothetical protein ACFY9A_24980 [Streptomyces rubradiris]|uniref:nSTAND1 domain-containing NTPase n=1 Tax=Streptomyces rubradiris TaxID=285531 RepID=UPI0036F054E9
MAAVLEQHRADQLVVCGTWLPVTVGEMTESEQRRVMTGPLERVGTVAFADGLVERVLDDLKHTPNPLPLLEFTLAELWARRRARLLTHAAYEIWAGIAPGSREVADRLLIQLVRPLPEGDLSRRRRQHRPGRLRRQAGEPCLKLSWEGGRAAQE